MKDNINIMNVWNRNGNTFPELGQPLEGRSTYLRRPDVVLSAIPLNPEEGFSEVLKEELS